ncbi:MAG: A/G-specific adenine glycosylase [Lachnospiraceae bacterium]
MLQDYPLEPIVEPVLTWYAECKRDLPWRKNRDAYSIWVSEIMLQQTRVEAVIGYYLRFMKELPDVYALAECPEEKLLKLWEGLGYYNRVRNMQEAARTVCSEYHGKLPRTSRELLGLKGIGSYTARAIASQAYEEPVAAVDGNVLRVVTRLTRDDTDIMKTGFRTQVEGVLDGLLEGIPAGEFNQAMMELGAIVCVPNGEPHCEKCPVQNRCEGRRVGDEMAFPVKKAAAPRKIEKRTIFLVRRGNGVWIQKRKNSGLLAGLYEYPGETGWLTAKEALDFVKKQGFVPLRIKETGEAKHIFSHVEWHMKGYEIRLDETQPPKEEVLFATKEEMEGIYPIPSAFEFFKSRLSLKTDGEQKESVLK